VAPASHREVISRYDDIEARTKAGEERHPAVATIALVAGRRLIFRSEAHT